MNKVNNKGFTIIEIILSFSFIMIISVGLFLSATNYKNKQQLESLRRDLETYKMNIITDIHKEIDKRGLESIEKDHGFIILNFYDGESMQIVKLIDLVGNSGVAFEIDVNNKKSYYLNDSSSIISDIELVTSNRINFGASKKGYIYKINITVHNDKIGDYPISIVLTSFSNS